MNNGIARHLHVQVDAGTEPHTKESMSRDNSPGGFQAQAEPFGFEGPHSVWLGETVLEWSKKVSQPWPAQCLSGVFQGTLRSSHIWILQSKLGIEKRWDLPAGGLFATPRLLSAYGSDRDSPASGYSAILLRSPRMTTQNFRFR